MKPFRSISLGAEADRKAASIAGPANSTLLTVVADEIARHTDSNLVFNGIAAERIRLLAAKLDERETDASAWRETAHAVDQLRHDEARMYQRIIADMAAELEDAENEAVTVTFVFGYDNGGISLDTARALFGDLTVAVEDAD